MATKYQISLTPQLDTIQHFRDWAGDVQGIAYALGYLGFAKQSDTYTAQWANAVSAGSAALPLASSNLIGSTCFPATSNDSRVALASTHFLGAYNGSTSYVAGDVVTSSAVGSVALVFIALQAGSGHTCDNTAYWSPYYMEVWKMTGGGLTDVYIKVEYGSTTAATIPMVTMQFGTTWSSGASGYLSDNVSLTEQLFLGTTGINGGECDFCGDGQNYFICHFARGGTAAPGPAVFGWERSISGTSGGAPVYNSSYITYVKGFAAVAHWWQQSLFLSGSPATAVRTNWVNTMSVGAAAATLVVNNTTPCFPVFPLVGYCGNPLTILITQQSQDTTEGTTQTCTVYGTALSYILSKTTVCLGIGNNGGNYYGVGVRYN